MPLTENHLRRLLQEWVLHYNAGRPPISLGPGIPQPPVSLLGVDLQGAYLNLDGGFDSAHNRTRIFHAGLIPNIPKNPRHCKPPKRGRQRFFHEAIQALRMRVERTFAWEDKFKRLLLRFERIQQRHYGMKLLAYTLSNLHKFCGT